MRVVERVTGGFRAGWRRYRVWSALAWLAVTAAALVVVWSIFGPVGEWAAGSTVTGIADAEKRAAAINAVRQTLLAAAAGLAAVTGLAFTARSFFLSRRGQLTDRYTKAITQLASDKLEERLGGIYSLEHLMRESARDHQTVVDVLAAFIREHAPISAAVLADGPVTFTTMTRITPPDPRPQPTDVQAALTVLGRRPPRREPHRLNLTRTALQDANLSGARLQDANLYGANLQGANLTAVDLRGADLTRAWLGDAELQGANLRGANLYEAHLYEAHLQGAHLYEARLQGANLVAANLQDANLRGANLTAARLENADLENADLSGAELQGAELERALGITVRQLRAAHWDQTTVLGRALRADLDSVP